MHAPNDCKKSTKPKETTEQRQIKTNKENKAERGHANTGINRVTQPSQRLSTHQQREHTYRQHNQTPLSQKKTMGAY